MSLPDSRDQTFGYLSQVGSSFLNNEQDAIIAHERKVNQARSILRECARTTQISTTTAPPGSEDFCWVYGGGASPNNDLGALTVYSHPGLIGQAPLAGGEVLVYPAAENELQTSFADGDVTNPRWDIVQIKLENENGHVKLTKSAKAGTPAASPVEPTPDAGYVKWAAVRIPAGQTVFSTHLDPLTDLRDYRMPSRIHTITIPGIRSFGTWAASVGRLYAVEPAGASEEQYFIPAFDSTVLRNGRLVEVQLLSKYGSGFSDGEARISRMEIAEGTEVEQQLVIVGGFLLSASFAVLNVGLLLIEPYWLNGYAAGPAAQSSDLGELHHLALVLSSHAAADKIWWARFIVAGD
ncbi:MAG: hypothetical protein V2A73_14840 [Pseudomonadota bacterium]